MALPGTGRSRNLQNRTLKFSMTQFLWLVFAKGRYTCLPMDIRTYSLFLFCEAAPNAELLRRFALSGILD